MKNLQITNSRFITYTDDLLTVDVLGGVDLSQVERMVCTLRITYNDYPPQRTTLDLYNDNQTDKLQRTLCDKWGLKLLEASRSLYTLTLQLEEYRLQQLRYTGKSPQQAFSPSEEDRRKAVRFLSEKNLSGSLMEQLNTIGILGEDRNALILFLALASHKSANPFSVLCLAKSGIGKSYILQKLSECMPDGSFSFHSRISANALYYFDSGDINGKALFIEDLEWTTQMLQPLATLQTQGRLVNTRATKDKDGMLHSTTFEVIAKLCLIACAYSAGYAEWRQRTGMAKQTIFQRSRNGPFRRIGSQLPPGMEKMCIRDSVHHDLRQSGEYCRKLYTDLRKTRTTGLGCRRSRHFHLNGPYPQDVYKRQGQC